MPKLTLKADGYNPLQGFSFFADPVVKSLSVAGFDGTPFGCIHAVFNHYDLRINYTPTLSPLPPSAEKVSRQLVSSLYGEKNKLVLGTCVLTNKSNSPTTWLPHEEAGGLLLKGLINNIEQLCTDLRLNIPKVRGNRDNLGWRVYDDGNLMSLVYGPGETSLDIVSVPEKTAATVISHYNPAYVLSQLRNSTDRYVNFNGNCLFINTNTFLWVSPTEQTVRVVSGEIPITEFMFGTECVAPTLKRES